MAEKEFRDSIQRLLQSTDDQLSAARKAQIVREALQATGTRTQLDSIDETRVGSALIVSVLGLLLPAILVLVLVFRDWKVADIATIVGLFTSVVGTLVGAFLGAQIGSSGKKQAEDTARRALAALRPETAQQILQSPD